MPSSDQSLRRGEQRRSLQGVPPEAAGAAAGATYYRLSSSNLDNTSTSPSRLEIEILNPKPSTEVWYSVTIVSHNKYTGTAMNMGLMPSSDTSSANSLLYYWKPPFRGEYQVIVHELPQFSNGNEPTVPFEISSVTVQDANGYDSITDYMLRMQSLQSCSRLRRPGLFTAWNGDWIGPDLLLNDNINNIMNGALRTKWAFVPGSPMNCKIDYFTDEDLSSIPSSTDGTSTTISTKTKKSIYILGTSKERGVFLSLIDMLLNPAEKTHLEKSVISKCWGRAIITKYNLSILYQDWRSNFFEPPSSTPSVICHDDKVVREGGSTFVNNGYTVWKDEVFNENKKEEWPEVILMSIGGTVGFDQEYDLQRFISDLPPSWEGTLFFTDGTFSARDAGRGTIRDYENYRSKLMGLTNGPMFDRRVHWLDGMGISKEMRLYAEDGPEHVSRSQHFHGNCDLPYGDEDNNGGNEKRMMICSNVTEMVAQLMLNYALGPKEQLVETNQQLGPSSRSSTRDSEMTYCHACPADMLPFHITPYPDMTCAKGSLHERTQNEIKKRTVPQTCPDDCLTLKVERFVPTQSGFVHERVCPINVFTVGMEREKDHAATSLIGQEEIQMKMYPLGLAVFATVVLRLFFRGRLKSLVAILFSLVQRQVSSEKLEN